MKDNLGVGCCYLSAINSRTRGIYIAEPNQRPFIGLEVFLWWQLCSYLGKGVQGVWVLPSSLLPDISTWWPIASNLAQWTTIHPLSLLWSQRNQPYLELDRLRIVFVLWREIQDNTKTLRLHMYKASFTCLNVLIKMTWLNNR